MFDHLEALQRLESYNLINPSHDFMPRSVYMANVTRVYRETLDRVTLDETPSSMPDPKAHYNLEMAFSRGLHTGWFEGDQ